MAFSCKAMNSPQIIIRDFYKKVANAQVKYFMMAKYSYEFQSSTGMALSKSWRNYILKT